MHVHGLQSNLNFQINPAYVARAEARREAERTREKLRSAASSLANETDEEGFVVSLSEREDARRQSGQENAENQNGQKQPSPQPSGQQPAATDEAFSDYA